MPDKTVTDKSGAAELRRDPAAGTPLDDEHLPDAEYTCVLRIDGCALDLAAMDTALNLQGEHVCVNRRATQRRSAINLRRWQYPMGDGGDGTYRIWSSIEEALGFSVKDLFPVRATLENYVANENAYWWIGCFHRPRSSLIYLPHDLLEKLAAIGAPAYFDNYHASSDKVETDGDVASAIGDEEEDDGLPIHRYRFWIDKARGPGDYLSRVASLSPSEEDTDFAAGLGRVIDRLEEDHLRSAASGTPRVLVCEHTQYAFDGGPIFTRAHLEALSNLGVDVAMAWTS